MSRSEEVRQEVLRLDDHRCQITGMGGHEMPLQVHHWRPLGAGGSEALDTVENCITLAETIHLEGIHPGVSVPTARILHWDRSDKENGLIVERHDSLARVWLPWPKEELWFYKRQDAEVLEKEIEMVRQVQLVESKHAEIMAHIWENYSLLSDAVSPEQFVAGLGLDSKRAQEEARAARWIEENGLTWPNGVNVRKVLLIASAYPQTYVAGEHPTIGPWNFDARPEAQDVLDQAVDTSYSDLRKALIEKGLKRATMRWYLLIGQDRRPFRRIHTDILFVRSRDYEIVMSRRGVGVKVIEVNAFKAGIRWDRKAQKLYDRDGHEIAYEDWTTEAV